MKLAVDAMGGDYAPEKVVQGVELARDEFADTKFILFGKEDQIRKYLKNGERITIVHTDSEIEMGDEPVRAVRQKKTSSLVLAAQSVKDGKTDALFSAGNTGALLAASLFIIGRIKGIDRPGMTTTLPSLAGPQDSFTMLDVGANAESKVKNLQQFAILGNFYSSNVAGITNPRIALLNNGAEEDKGDTLHKETYQALAKDSNLNFVGNIESRELLNGTADVVVTDGFTGNAVLKNTEGTALSLLKLIKHSILDSGVQGKLGGLMLKPVFKVVQDKMDYSKHGGAVLLGVKAPVVKAHGSSNETQIYHALSQLRQMVDTNLTTNLADYFATRSEQNKEI
ncbi:Phosphate:acyl-ACP acyltransferase PlsX [Pediococcus damnosus]|uniref:Phosphate acyltransferase n=1 Tax=Pediococcus damnosus TaxID=51663 RepID=A0A0R2H7T5_9LACO|nr:phosphate acyltransferase PlsX [Pediococcus damnosus]AMV62203.1 Phosphate:acyl-ACP acyltransferase PlsX [Pediococcus damnosus]AMV67939.1 Phosphate:acyl-ACP acyltransferase PlsX [Pediococcus damnosus]AMV70136.1 Phosphate:acyl-ACP acyltransferase PlsX [Pediococcus damnosus]KJU74963.1 phosphate acyltransferase [Pediococcus damnosus LMG 28219]KRN45684.1 plsX protein [Pediococcus damnosus]